MLSKYRGAKSRVSLDSPSPATEAEVGGGASRTVVLPSSTELFYFYAQALESCAQLSIGTGKTLLDLSRVQGRWLQTYAREVLTASMRRPPSALVTQTRRSMEVSRPDTDEMKNACLVINTAEYCQTTAEEVRLPFYITDPSLNNDWTRWRKTSAPRLTRTWPKKSHFNLSGTSLCRMCPSLVLGTGHLLTPVLLACTRVLYQPRFNFSFASLSMVSTARLPHWRVRRGQHNDKFPVHLHGWLISAPC
jgi:hypothetical protein